MAEHIGSNRDSTLESERLIAAAYAAIGLTGNTLGPPPPTGAPVQQVGSPATVLGKTTGKTKSSSSSSASKNQKPASAFQTSRSSAQSTQTQQAQAKTKATSTAAPQSSRYAEARRKHAAPVGQPVAAQPLAPHSTVMGQASGTPQSINTTQSSSSTSSTVQAQPPPPTSTPVYTNINTTGKPTQAAPQRSQTPRPPSGTPVSTATPPRKVPTTKPAPQKKSSSSGCVSWIVILGIGLLILRWLGIEL